MPDAISPRALSSLIASIYDCVLDPDLWDGALNEMRDTLCCQTAILGLSDLRRNAFLIYRTVGVEPYWQQEQLKYLPEVHGLLTRDLELGRSLDEPLVLSRNVSREYLETSPYVQECLKPQGLVDTIQLFLMQTPTRVAGVGLGRHERQGIITNTESELGGLLLPHLRRAVTISDVLDARSIERTRMSEALDALRCGVVLADERSSIVHANRSAEQMLRNGAPIHGSRGVLSVKTSAAAKELRSAIQLAAKNEAELGKTGLAIRLTEFEEPPVFAHVLPMTGSDTRARLQPGAAVAVFIGAPDGQDGADTMATAYDLTPTETRVLTSLLTGRTLSETAAALNIAMTTAKTHLDNIFSKTGVTRQTDLVLLASRAASPARTTA